MAKKKQALGRGLSALLSDRVAADTLLKKDSKKLVGQILEISIGKIKTNPYQPRIHFDDEALKDLSQSIKELGVIQPITIRKEGNVFELISGERRLRASKLAGLEVIPAYVRLANDQEMLEMALVENIQRQDLDSIEVALSYQRLIEEINLTQEKLSERVGKDRSTITNYLRLLKLDPIIQNAIRSGEISMGHGKALMSINLVDLQLKAFKTIVKESFSVRNTEEYVKGLKNNSVISTKNASSSKSIANKEYSIIKKIIAEKLGVKVDLSQDKKGKGKVVIYFDNESELKEIQNKIVAKN